MAAFELPDMPTSKVTPHMLMGAASPLWSYFGAAAAGGVAYWWMTRWTQPVNLEALFGKAVAAPALALEEIVEPVVEAVAEAVTEAAEAVPEAVTSVVEATAEIVEAAVEATIETVEEAVAAGAETVAEALPGAGLPEMPVGGEAAPISPLVEVLAAPEPEPAAEPPMEATADPLPEPAPKPRTRKSPANGFEA